MFYGYNKNEEGYKNPKPFIDVSGYPMVLQALSKFPICSQNIFVVQENIFQSEGEADFRKIEEKTIINLQNETNFI